MEAIRRDAHEHILQAQQKYQVAEQETIEVKNSLNDLESKWQNLVDENRSADKKYRDLQFEFNDYAKSSRARINLVESALQKCHQESETRAESLNQQRNKLILEFQQEKNTLNLEISKRDNQIIDLKSRVESLHKMYTNLQQEKVNETKQTETCRINANKERIEFEHQIQVIKTDHENKVMALRSEISKRDLILEGFDKKVVQLHSLIDTKQYDIDNLKNELSKMIDNEKKLEEKLLNCIPS